MISLANYPNATMKHCMAFQKVLGIMSHALVITKWGAQIAFFSFPSQSFQIVQAVFPIYLLCLLIPYCVKKIILQQPQICLCEQESKYNGTLENYRVM